MTATTSGLRLELREYQEEALERIDAAEARGIRRQLGVAATGLGKTIIFCALAERRRARTLVLVHRDELVTQAVTKMREVWPDVDVGIVKAGQDDIDAHVVVASVQTVSRQRRLDRLNAAIDSTLISADPFELVVVDEAHHTAADSYRRVLEGLRAGEPDGPLLLGVTATPDRGDGKGLDDLFDEITWTYDILWGIRSGYLSDVRGLRVELDGLDLGSVRVSRGDYDAGQAGQALEDADAPQFVAQAWQKHASDRQTLVFTPTVALARACADEFSRRGVKAAWVSGETPLDERRAILADYAHGAIQVVSNCAVLTEGYDEPRTDCIVVARPTRSRALFTQMIGRGTRRHPDKDDLLVVDVVGASTEHSLVTVPSLFGLEHEWAERMGDGTGTLTDEIGAFEKHKVLVGIMAAHEADLFNKVREQGKMAWVRVDGETPRYQRSMGYSSDDGYVKLPTAVLVQKRALDDGSWLAGYINPDGAKHVMIADVSLEVAQGVGEDFVRKQLAGRGTHLVDKNAAWRKRPPSDRALAAARKWRMPAGQIVACKTAGELSDALDRHIAVKTGRS